MGETSVTKPESVMVGKRTWSTNTGSRASMPSRPAVVRVYACEGRLRSAAGSQSSGDHTTRIFLNGGVCVCASIPCD